MATELNTTTELAMSLAERHFREVAGLARITALEEATLGVSRYSAVTKAALGIDTWQKNYAELFESQFDHGELFASRNLMADFRAFEGIERSLKETLDAFSATGISASRSASAIAQALDVGGNLDTISTIHELTSNISGGMDRSVSELGRRALGISETHAAALRCSEVLASGMASQQSAVVDAFASLSQSPIHELAQLASTFDLAEWSEVEDTYDVDDEELRQRVLALLQVILVSCNKALNPAEWDTAAWRDFAFLAVATLIAFNTGYSEEDRARDEGTNQKVSETKLVAEQAAEFLSSMHEAEISTQRYLEFVNSLPRGEVVSARAYVREQPGRSFSRIATLKSGSPVAIVGRSGRWRKIIYRDELTDQLKEGWLWSGSIEMLED